MAGWKESIRRVLLPPIPGEKAHELMAPSERRPGQHMSDRGQARKSSVLILIYPTSEGLTVPFIQRPDYPGVHGGQISLPGGKCEPTDSNNWHTALRETHEELGIDISRIEYLGMLSQLYIPNSNYLVTPQVGFINRQPVFNHNTFEVEEVIEVPVKIFFEEEHKKKFTQEVNGITIEAPYFDVAGRKIWGATAMMLSEFIVAFRRKAPRLASAIHSCSAHSVQESP